jgi:hypothetical protein
MDISSSVRSPYTPLELAGRSTGDLADALELEPQLGAAPSTVDGRASSFIG